MCGDATPARSKAVRSSSPSSAHTSAPRKRTRQRRGAAVDLGRNDGTTPLHFASKKGHIAVVTALLGAGAVGGAAAVRKRGGMVWVVGRRHPHVPALRPRAPPLRKPLAEHAEGAIDLECQPGDVILFSNLLFHRGGFNSSDTIRSSL